MMVPAPVPPAAPVSPAPSRRRLGAVSRHIRAPAAPPAAAGAAAVHVPGGATISVTPLVELESSEHALGARITGLNLAALRGSDWELIWQAWLKFALLVFPGQLLSPREELTFYQRLPHRDTAAPVSSRRQPIPEAPDVGLVGNADLDNHHGVSGRNSPTGAGWQWHPDGSYDGTMPPAATQLYCLETPPKGVGSGTLEWPSAGSSAAHEGAATVFADCRYAYRRLDAQQQQLADRITTRYWAGGMLGRGAVQADGRPFPTMETSGLRPSFPPILPQASATVERRAAPAAPAAATTGGPNLSAFQDKEQKLDSTGVVAAAGMECPLVWRHPDTGVPAVMAHTLVMEELLDNRNGRALSWEESQAYVASLLDECTRPPRIYIHNWQQHELVIWDNFSTMHTITPWQAYKAAGAARLMHRLSLVSDWHPQ
eukprot:SAG22_NODE_854_length_6847_cov_3.834469_2_plen_428_part_00